MRTMTRAILAACVGFAAATSMAAEVPLLKTLRGHAPGVTSVAWNPNGRTLASGDGDGEIRIWDAAEGKCIRTLAVPSAELGYEMPGVLSLAWSPDGKTLASGNVDSTVRLWNVENGKNVAALEGHADCVDCVSWSPNGKALATVGGGEIKLWDVGTGKNAATFREPEEWSHCVVWSPDGKTLASGNGRGAVRLRSATSGKTIALLDRKSGENILALSYSLDGNMLASADGCRIELWDAARWKHLGSLEGHSSEPIVSAHGNFGRMYTPAVTSLAFRADGRILASGSQDKTVRLWDMARRKSIATLSAHSDAITSVAFSPDGRTLASASHDPPIRLSNVAAIAAEKQPERKTPASKNQMSNGQ